MDKLGDIELFVKVVQNKGFAAAARVSGMSPASVTIKINRIEERYGVRLLNRTTRSVALTEEGGEFFERCLRILSEVEEAEEQLMFGKESLCGSLKVSAPVDLGQQIIAPLLAEFSEEHPGISAQLNLTDSVTNLIEDGFDVGIRFGVLKDNRMIARKLSSNRRILCASPEYIKKYGTPKKPQDLILHRCLTMVRRSEDLTQWHFKSANEEKSISINPVLASNNGAQLRLWALSGYGIILKSYWDVKSDISSKKLVPLLEDYIQDFESTGLDGDANLNVVYPNREYLPERIRSFINILVERFEDK